MPSEWPVFNVWLNAWCWESQKIIFQANFLMLKNSYLGILELLYL